MINNHYPLGFRTRLHRKDLGIALETARELGVPVPVAAYVEQVETSLVQRGYGDEDVSNLARVVREGAGLENLRLIAYRIKPELTNEALAPSLYRIRPDPGSSVFS